MKAVVYDRYGPPEVLRIEEIATPTPKDDEILIRTHVTTVTSADWRVRSLTVPTGFGLIMRLVFGIRKPRQPILGSELAGVVAAIGNDVTRFKVGERVFAFSDARMGCHAEVICLPQDGLVVATPPGLTDEAAAALSFGGTTALDFLRQGKVQAGDKVLVNGASGAVGTAVVQLARHFGAEVTGVCSMANRDLVIALGAAHVIDYTKVDFTHNGETYDLIVDTVGTVTYSRCKRSLKDGGRLLMVVAGLPDMLLGVWVSLISRHTIIAGPVAVKRDDLLQLAALAEAGDIQPVIDRIYPFEQIVAAHRYVDTGRKKGNVIISVRDPS
ncbi:MULTISPECIES: NAD(P)-dependent alcohol dehydrogenase [unclassified Cyanobium]|uniref:NAD(P)-dependent alcohol dehydrogenase n=1 Tax=unclassified Cyanobium TaxID=2627006 RepID=UPI0020CE1B85|nr:MULTISPECIES: NAD(P)-dependent alcohol dehydrogenase [unclassified Cyanobium]MCP9833425.1 NAD(P)-dependent alcohol dehydrogenase [Cyanobium sp. La Preciosa 7G6]MCP9936190.1 NAD(P)-dependent alcohol dehydrogenase [Cyanobium sp. Aljojuca 7A6]